MIDKKSNIYTVLGFTLLFSMFFLYSFFGIGMIASRGVDERIIEKTFDNDVDVLIRGKASHVFGLLSIIGSSDALEMPEELGVLDEMLDKIYVSGKYSFNEKKDIHSANIALTDESFGLELMSISLLYDGDRMYFTAEPFIDSNYYYDSPENQENDEVDFFNSLLDQSQNDIRFVRREGYDGKAVYQYEYETLLLLNDRSYTMMRVYVKPDGKISEIVIGKDLDALNLYFVEHDFELDESDFEDAIAYDVNSFNSDLIEYTEEILE